MRTIQVVKLARNLVALPIPLFAVLLAGGPLGCELLSLGIPEPPKLPEMPQAPETPEIEVPKPPDAPDVKAPEAPKVDAPDPEGGACCLRSGEMISKACGSGVKRCCSGRIELDECEAAGGLWFHTVQGCAGSC
jgi:hypothetical protein